MRQLSVDTTSTDGIDTQSFEPCVEASAGSNGSQFLNVTSCKHIRTSQYLSERRMEQGQRAPIKAGATLCTVRATAGEK